MKRYFKLLGIFITNSVQLELEYRANFFFNILNSLIATGTGFLILFSMFNKAKSVGGWTFYEALTLFGVFMVLEAFIDILLYPNLPRMAEYIRKGDMDFFLLKPVSSQFMVSFRYTRLWMLPQVLLAFGVIAYGMAQTKQLNLANLALLFALLLCAILIVYAIWFMLNTSAFWFVKVENISELFNAFFMAGSFPVTAFPTWARFLLTFLVPIAFITTVPASAAIGRLNPGFALGSLLFAAALVFISQAFWRYAVANYTSASS